MQTYPPSPALLLLWNERASFDGNVTSMLTNWMIPLPSWTGLNAEAIERLTEVMVEDDNIAWMILVVDGYRV